MRTVQFIASAVAALLTGHSAADDKPILKPGTYFFWCNTVSQPGQPSHAVRGMVGEVVVS